MDGVRTPRILPNAAWYFERRDQFRGLPPGDPRRICLPYDPHLHRFVGNSAMHYLLFYTYVPDVLERRAGFRGAHLKHAWAAQERGELVLAGALADPVDGGVLWFSAPDKSVAERFASDDPYVKGGLVTKWVVREWVTVVGDAAVKPIRPDA